MGDASYLKLYREGILEEKVREALKLLDECRICPRECSVNRNKRETGFCKTGRWSKIASFSPHFGEERPLVGKYGSGTIFFSSCNLLCSFCQNYDISHLNKGSEVLPKELASIMIRLQDMGCRNINFVTPSHVIPQILEALFIAVQMGLRVPLVYNTGAYDKVESLKLLDGIFDIYMPDFKFWDSQWAETFCSAADYPEKAASAIREMHRQVGDLMINRAGLAVRGLLVRHLVMPEDVSGTRNIMRFLAEEISTETYLNVMDQYSPLYRADEDPRINRRIKRAEYERALRWAREAGLKRLDQRRR